MKSALTAICFLFATSAQAKVTRVVCDAWGGGVSMQAAVSLLDDEWDLASSGGYDLDLSSARQGGETQVKILVSSGGGLSSFSTIETIRLSGPRRELVRDFVGDFLLTCVAL